MSVDMMRLGQLIEELFRITDELADMTGRPFTPDGHLVGSIGEAIAASEFGLELLPPSTRGRDAVQGEFWIEIKATFGRSVAFRRNDLDDEYGRCLVMKLSKAQPHLERVIYNGPIRPILSELALRPFASNGQIQLSLSKLEALNSSVADHDRVRRAANQDS
ncbi:MAG: hypothetical protein R3D27_01095 [Hyphomicrobiaceae bacterium]